MDNHYGKERCGLVLKEAEVTFQPGLVFSLFIPTCEGAEMKTTFFAILKSHQTSITLFAKLSSR